MCLTVNKFQEPKIAEQDIICYKVYFIRNNRMYSFYREEITREGRQLKTFFSYEESPHTHSLIKYVERGYHSFKNLSDANYLHTKNIGARNQKTNVIYKCIIPKGTPYYEGNFGPNTESYASLELIVEEKIK